MILVDHRVGSKELIPKLKALNLPTEETELPYGDVAFEGKGPQGSVSIGIERKTLHDMLGCIEDARFSGHQFVGMRNLYTLSVLQLEGHWKPHDGSGLLMEGFNGGHSWGYCKFRSQRAMYSKLYRYLISTAMAGVIITQSRDLTHSAFNIGEWYHYFQKRWDDHTSFREIQKIAIPTLGGKPTLVRKWANDLDGIGTKLSGDAERLFKTPLALANADESEWLRIPGVGIKTAQSIVREIWGQKR
jgi:ERCC4-type nuclease